MTKRWSIGLILFALAFFTPAVFAAEDNPADAIAIRVMPNQEHYSPMRWYQSNVLDAGSPQSLEVDGYQAIRDDRTVYVSAANIENDKLYTNIYIISMNQNPESDTTDIFAQILKYWKFNVDLSEATGPGTCRLTEIKSCALDSDCQTGLACREGQCVKSCWLDKDCGNGGICDSQKAKLRRDVRRLAALTDAKSLIDRYFAANSEFPTLPAGTYLTGKSISVWPSWNDTLSKTLGGVLPRDPVNKLGSCPGFDALTCWNEASKRFATDFNDPVLPLGSLAFVYDFDTPTGRYRLCANFETAYANLPAEFKCDSFFGAERNNDIQVTLGGLTASEGSFAAFVSVSSRYPIDWSKTIITPVTPSGWGGWSQAGWSFVSGSSGLKLSPTGIENIRRLEAQNIKLPDNRGFGRFDLAVKVFDRYGGFGEAQGTITICQPRDCEDMECGQIGDNCGGTLLCGDCSGRNDGKIRCVNYKCSE